MGTMRRLRWRRTQLDRRQADPRLQPRTSCHCLSCMPLAHAPGCLPSQCVVQAAYADRHAWPQLAPQAGHHSRPAAQGGPCYAGFMRTCMPGSWQDAGNDTPHQEKVQAHEQDLTLPAGGGELRAPAQEAASTCPARKCSRQGVISTARQQPRGCGAPQIPGTQELQEPQASQPQQESGTGRCQAAQQGQEARCQQEQE